MSAFAGFQPNHFEFFLNLVDNNNTAWFRQHRSSYDAIVENLRALVDAISPFLFNLDPRFEMSGKVGANLTRINRDIRFSNDKSPYKRNLYVLFYRRGMRPKSAGRLYVGLAYDCVTVGFSIYSGEKGEGSMNQVLIPRTQSHLPLLLEYLKNRRIPARYDGLRYVLEKREWLEADPFPDDPTQWMRTKGFVVRKRFPASQKALAKQDFLTTIQSIFLDLFPLYIFGSHPESDWQNRFTVFCKSSAKERGRTRENKLHR